MIICVCKAVSDRQLGALVHSGVASVEELQLETGCGTCCGQCLPHIEAMVGSDAAGSQPHGLRISAAST